jgi:hypothetical protein
MTHARAHQRAFPAVIVAGLLGMGALYFAYMMLFNRGVVAHEPGDLTVFSH